jgi:hypothetical protein
LDTILQQLGADKGLLNADRTDELETLLKEVVNVNKDTLSYITTIVYNLPILGPTLGPSKYTVTRYCYFWLMFYFSRLRAQVHT